VHYKKLGKDYKWNVLTKVTNERNDVRKIANIVKDYVRML